MSKKRPEPMRERTDTIVEDDETVRTNRPPPMKGAAIAKVATKVVEQRGQSRAAQEEKVARTARTRHPGREDTYTAPPKTLKDGGGGAEEARLAAMRELYAKGDAEAALSVARGLKTKTKPMAFAPSRPPSGDYQAEAQTYEVEARTISTKRSAPRLLMSRAQIMKTPLDPRARELVERIDGTTPMRRIIEDLGLADDVAQKLIERLLSLGVITFA